jgi:hypothetical protein
MGGQGFGRCGDEGGASGLGSGSSGGPRPRSEAQQPSGAGEGECAAVAAHAPRARAPAPPARSLGKGGVGEQHPLRRSRTLLRREDAGLQRELVCQVHQQRAALKLSGRHGEEGVAAQGC